jgi:hypothetical protein
MADLIAQSKSELEASFHLLGEAGDDTILKQLEAQTSQPVHVVPGREESWGLAYSCTEVRFYQGAQLVWKSKKSPARVRVPKKVAVTLINGKSVVLLADSFMLEGGKAPALLTN